MARDLMLVLVGAFLGGAGKSGWDAVSARSLTALRQRKERRAVAAEAERIATADAAAEEAESRMRAEYQAERVGATFRRRYTAEDTGTLLTVVGLDERAWRSRVLVEESAPDGRTPTGHESPDFARTSFEWSSLTMPHADQRHRTARVIERSHNDEDGWVEFERIDSDS